MNNAKIKKNKNTKNIFVILINILKNIKNIFIKQKLKKQEHKKDKNIYKKIDNGLNNYIIMTFLFFILISMLSNFLISYLFLKTLEEITIQDVIYNSFNILIFLSEFIFFISFSYFIITFLSPIFRSIKLNETDTKIKKKIINFPFYIFIFIILGNLFKDIFHVYKEVGFYNDNNDIIAVLFFKFIFNLLIYTLYIDIINVKLNKLKSRLKIYKMSKNEIDIYNENRFIISSIIDALYTISAILFLVDSYENPIDMDIILLLNVTAIGMILVFLRKLLYNSMIKKNLNNIIEFLDDNFMDLNKLNLNKQNIISDFTSTGFLSSNINDFTLRLNKKIDKLIFELDNLNNDIYLIKNDLKSFKNMIFNQSKDSSFLNKNIDNLHLSTDLMLKQISKQETSINKTIVEISQKKDIAKNNLKNVYDDIYEIQNDFSSMQKNIDYLLSSLSISDSVQNYFLDVSNKIKEANNMMVQASSFLQQINEISEKTSLLSVNASIEAARAGHIGEGFAVITGEVQSLSENTSKTVENVSIVIENTTKKINESIHIIGESENFIVDNKDFAYQSRLVIKSLDLSITKMIKVLINTYHYMENQNSDMNDFLIEIKNSKNAFRINKEEINEYIKECDILKTNITKNVLFNQNLSRELDKNIKNLDNNILKYDILLKDFDNLINNFKDKE